MATLEELLIKRRELRAAKRSLTLNGVEPDVKIESNTHFYLLAFNGGKGAARLLRSGTFMGSEDASGPNNLRLRFGQSSDPSGRRLIRVVWDGDDGPSTHPADTFGLLHTGDNPMLLAVASLEEIEYVDERVYKQREAHPLGQDGKPAKKAD